MDSAVLQAAIARATQNGVIVVAASGNAGTTQAYFPGAYPAVAGVGAWFDGQVAIFSQRNPAGKQYTWLVAPGVSVYHGGIFLQRIPVRLFPARLSQPRRWRFKGSFSHPWTNFSRSWPNRQRIWVPQWV